MPPLTNRLRAYPIRQVVQPFGSIAHCYMRDLSEGGAYLETDQPVELDQQLVLTLFSSMLEQSCAIKGIVVRRDKKGIGVRFEDLISKQKHVIRSLIESCCVPIPKPSE